MLVSRFADGKPLGNFRYYGTRPDDPNDIVPHEHRRELRGARVFGAWLNHDDSRGVNSLDMLVEAQNRRYVKHYMFDFGSIMGSGTVYAQRHRPGNEYILEWKPGWLTLATLGALHAPMDAHSTIRTCRRRSAGLRAEAFQPAVWKPEYPNSAFDNMRPDDAFWAARICRRFRRRRDPRHRREGALHRSARDGVHDADAAARGGRRCCRRWLTQVNPLVDFALSDTGELTFANAAEQAGVAAPARAIASSGRDSTTRPASRPRWAARSQLTSLASARQSTSPARMPRPSSSRCGCQRFILNSRPGRHR